MDFKNFSGVTFDIGEDGRNNLAQTKKNARITEAIEKLSVYKGKIDIPNDASRKEKKTIRKFNEELAVSNASQIKEFITETRSQMLKVAKDYMHFQLTSYVEEQKNELVNKATVRVKNEIDKIIAQAKKENNKRHLEAFTSYLKEKEAYEQLFIEATSESSKQMALYMADYMDRLFLEYLENEKTSNDTYENQLRENMTLLNQKILSRF